MAFIKTKDGTEIFYKDWGRGQPIVFHHGWPLSADDWDTRDPCRTLDRRGRGDALRRAIRQEERRETGADRGRAASLAEDAGQPRRDAARGVRWPSSATR